MFHKLKQKRNRQTCQVIETSGLYDTEHVICLVEYLVFFSHFFSFNEKYSVINNEYYLAEGTRF